MHTIGIDFGTTNSVASLASDNGDFKTLTFRNTAATESIFPTLLAFWQDDSSPAQHVTCADAGQWAIESFLTHAPDCRFLKSIKTFAASASFSGTTIYGRRLEFADLMRLFLDRMFAHGNADSALRGASVVIGRPIKFAGFGANADVAKSRYETALRALGATDLRTVYEPLAAAYYFVSGMQGEATVFVGDFGGGTSDYSIIRISRKGDSLRFEPLASRGLGLAGDQFDARIVQNIIAPALGSQSKYRSMGKDLEIPPVYFQKLSQWNEFSNLRGTKAYREIVALRSRSRDPELLDRFIKFIDSEMQYELSEAVAQTKRTLSSRDSARFALEFDGASIEAEVSRAQFEHWITPDLNRLDCLVDDTLAEAGLVNTDIDTVFLTGGTSLVPAVRNIFESRFGNGSIESNDQLISVAKGLALIATDNNADEWIADPRIKL